MTNKNSYDLEFFWDPICPFAWITSRWIHKVKEEYEKNDRQFNVDWKFICLMEINREKNYDKFPTGYREAHLGGKQMLRVAAAIRKEHGREIMEQLYTAFGETIWDQPPPELNPDQDPSIEGLAEMMKSESNRARIQATLKKLDLPETFLDAVDDDSYDQELADESMEALSRTGKDVGTPIITIAPPDGPSFFGPVISEVPKTGEEAVQYFEAVLTLLQWKGFAEIKRSLREMPQLKVLGNKP